MTEIQRRDRLDTDESLARRTADAVLDSVADLPAWLGITGAV